MDGPLLEFGTIYLISFHSCSKDTPAAIHYNDSLYLFR
jgi:hypothetical protein